MSMPKGKQLREKRGNGQMHLHRQVEDAHGPQEHVLQLDSVNDVDCLSPQEPPASRLVSSTHPGMKRMITTTTMTSAPPPSSGFRVKQTNVPPDKETMLSDDRNIRIQFRGGIRQIRPFLPLARV